MNGTKNIILRMRLDCIQCTFLMLLIRLMLIWSTCEYLEVKKRLNFTKPYRIISNAKVFSNLRGYFETTNQPKEQKCWCKNSTVFPTARNSWTNPILQTIKRILCTFNMVNLKENKLNITKCIISFANNRLWILNQYIGKEFA